MFRPFFLIAVVLWMMVSCVSTRKYDTLMTQYTISSEVKSRHEKTIEDQRSQIAALERARVALVQDSLRLSRDYRVLQERYDKLLADGSAEAAQLMQHIREAQQELESRSMQLAELEGMLRQNDEFTRQMREIISRALTGFVGEGLSVSERAGKVYVTLEENLLFASGSFDIESRGREAVQSLAKLLTDNPQINIMVEGHTDTVPYRGSGPLRDNWDLSVKRATTVVRLLLESGDIDPARIIASGRSQFDPIDRKDTPEARQRNRRTEIILTPRLEELMMILQKED